MNASLPRELAPRRAAPEGGQLLLAIALLITSLAYLGTLHFNFVYDDGPQIISNPTLTSWRSLPSLFAGNTWSFLIPGWAGNYYRPIFMSWLLLNRMLWGLNPTAWHASTLLVHLLATWMSFLVARQILGSGTQAGFVALLFGLHPIHIESVAWISGVTDPLMAIFVFAAFWAWIRGELTSGPRIPWRALSAVFYLVACLSKETAILLPLVLVAYDLLCRDQSTVTRTVLRTWPLWIAAALYIALRAFALRGLLHPIGMPSPLLTIPTILWGYFRRLLWPVHLSLFYDTPPVTAASEWRFWLPLIAWIAVAIAVYLARRSRILLFSLVWIFSFLAPAILGLPVFYVGEWIHDRYLYLPSFGFCLLLGYAIAKLPSHRRLFALPAAPASAMLGLVALMAFGTAWQQQYWRNSLLLFLHSVNEAPRSSWAKGYLAAELLRRGDRDDAQRMYEAALQLDPSNWKNNVAYGALLYQMGDYRRADEFFTRAIAGDPTDANAHFNQGLSRFNYGNYTGAETSLREALRRDPRLPQAHYWLGYSLERQGLLDDAREQYLAEIHQHPDSAADARRRFQMLAQK